jgi:acyl-CoA ligase (AMP-forming) (exosortase A-associated)
MYTLIPDLPLQTASRAGASPAVYFKAAHLTYETLARQIRQVAAGFRALGLEKQERVAVFLPKRFETVVAMFGASLAGAVFVPINPLLRAEQAAYIIRDCNVRILVTSRERLAELRPLLGQLTDLRTIVTVDERAEVVDTGRTAVSWVDLLAHGEADGVHRVIDSDMAAILYTSGSTGKPKGVVLSHRNMVAGARSVAGYLENRGDDRLLAVLPFSFDYGFSQLSTAFLSGASVVLMDYLLPRDVVTMVARQQITGLAGVPPLWIQIADAPWPAEAQRSLRYITNSGGAMPLAAVKKLRRALPDTRVYLMYGLTEAFRSTFLPPEEADRRPDSIGKAIPNAEVLVLQPDGTPCAPNQPGELVHRGALVAMGYWNDPQKTAERFKRIPARADGLVLPELAVWSGDTVRMDADGYLYFIGRRDEMIKTSGYRVSPTEIEEVLYSTGLVADAVAFGVPHPTLGHAIVVVASPQSTQPADTARLLDACRPHFPTYMLPHHVVWREQLPRNANGKFDRSRLTTEFSTLYASAET